MQNLKIRRVKKGDTEQLHYLFEIVVKDTFIKNGIDSLVDLMKDEINCKRSYLDLDLKSKGKERYFLVATIDNTIVGCIEFGKVGKLIMECTEDDICSEYEVGTIYVLPQYQNMGIGSKLLSSIIKKLRALDQFEFCIDSGYPSAQRIWRNKFGAPDFLLKDYWGEGADHMIWIIDIE